MHWIINAALSREPAYAALIAAVERQGREHTIVHKPPFAPYLTSGIAGDVDAEGHERPITLDIEGPIFVAGTTSMEHVSAAHGWSPGYITAPSQSECMKHWGGHMLNHGAVFGRLDKIAPPFAETFFLRPDEDIKNFAGRTMEPSGFEDWRRSILDVEGWTTMPAETMIMAAPLRTIWSEYRCIVVEGRYVTGSRYRTAGRVEYFPDVAPMVVDYVNARIAEWNPRPALAVDVAHTPDGLRIIETNSVSSAGFYAIDMEKFVAAISGLGRRNSNG